MNKILCLILPILLFITKIWAQNGIIPTTYDPTINVGFTTTQYESWLYKRVVNSTLQKLPFRLLKPKAYDSLRVTKYPLIVMLHGRGESGTNNQKQLLNGGKIHLDAVNMVNGVTFPGFIVFPQEPFGNWTNSPTFGPAQLTTSLSMVFDLVDSLKLKYNIDPNRIYVHGLSSGGSGTWAAIYNRPDLFAAALPMSTPGDTSQVRKICPIPIWLSQGGVDTNPIPYISHLMMAALRAAGAIDTNLTRYTEYPGQGHNIWNNTYSNPDFFPYMLRQNKLNIMVLGNNPICPGKNVDLSISSNFSNYQWFINSLSNSLTGANTYRLNSITTGGSYFAGFKRKADSPWEYSGSVNIIAGSASTKPDIGVKSSLFIPAPGSNNVVLTGPSNVKSYQWSNGASTKSITVNVSGIYSLKVDPIIGCTSYKSNDIVVRAGANGAAPPPAPTNLSAFPVSNHGILVKWQDNANNETGYEIYRGVQKGGPYAYIGALSVNSINFTDNNLAPNTLYYYKVRVVNEDGGILSLEETRATTTKDFITPTAPTGLQILRFTPTNIQLSWQPSFDSSGIKKYVVYNRDTLLGYSDTTLFNITKLIKGSGNSFRVVAQDNGGNLSHPSNDLPFFYNGVGLFSTYYEGDWSVLPNFATTRELKNGLVSNFTINTNSPLIINTLTGLEFTNKNTKFGIKSDGYIFINGITAGTTYKFFTTSDDGSKLWVNNTVVVDNDGAHGMLEKNGNYTFNAKGWYPISVGYYQGGGGYGLQTSYQCISGCVPSSLTGVKLTIPNNVLSYFNTGTTTGTSNPPTQNISLAGINYYPYSPNDKPRIRLQWIWSITGVTLRGFEVYRIKGGSAPGFTSNWFKVATVANQPVAPNVFRYIDSTDSPGVFLSANTKYYYAIKALTSIGNTAYIGYTGTVAKPTFLGINTPNTVPGFPAVPSNLTTLGISNSVIALSWTDNSNNESGFEVWRSYTKSGIFAKVLTIPRSYTSFNDSSCEANTKYVYKIRAFNAKGYSAFSNPDSTVSPNIPTSPSNLKAFCTGPASINLTWNVNTDIATGYSIYRSQTSWKTGFIKIDSITNPALSFYQDKTVIPDAKYYYKVRAFNNNVSAFSNVDSTSTLIDFAPAATDWKLIAKSVATAFNPDFNNVINQNKLIKSLTTKKDFFNYLAITPTGIGSITIKLPPIDSMPLGGMFTFNLAQGTGPANPKGDTINGNGILSFNNDYFGNGIYSVGITLSSDSTNWTVSGLNPLLRKRSNDLQKIDFPASFSGKWMKITFTNKFSFNPNLFLTEMGMYKILPPGTRHNYFLILGASIEEQNPPMGLAKFRERLSANGYTQGSTALVFNWAISGTNSMQLSDSIAPYIDMHPYAGYVMIHQGGNNINNTENGLRPLKFEMFSTSTSVQLFIQSFKNYFTTILSRGKIPFVSRMHFRDYKDGSCAGQLSNGPAVKHGRNQENGSLPYNLIIDSLTRIYAPFAYNDSERRSSINYYAISLNDQTIMGGDGIHPNNTSMQINKLADYWIKYVFKYVYTGSFSPPIPYSPGPSNICAITSPQYQDPPCWQKYANCGTVTPSNNIADYPKAPANKPNLMDSVNYAVELAKRTLAGKDIWNAKILVEQIGSTATRIPYVLSLDSLRDYRMPANPTNLNVFIVSNTSLNLSWIRNSLNNTGFEIYRSGNGGNSYKKVGVITVPGTFSYLDPGLSGDTIYYYYVRAVNGNFRSGWSNIINARPSSSYYCKASGSLTDLSTWGKNIDGSGLSPINFTASGQTFIVANRGGNSTVNSNWTVSGNYSKIVVSTSTYLTIGADCNATIDVLDDARLDIYGPTNPILGIIDTSSTISFGNSNVVPANTYGTVIFAGSGTRNLAPGTIYINRDLDIDPGIILQGNNTTISLNKNIIFSDASSALNNISLLINGDSASIDAKSGIVNLNGLTISGNSILSVINSSNLLVGSNAGGSVVINTGGKLYLNNGSLSVTGTGALNPGTTTGQLFVNGASLYLGTSGTLAHNLYFDDALNSAKDLYINLGSSSSQVNLYSALNMTNTLKLQKGIFNSNQFLTLISNNNFTARLAKVEATASLNGQITVQRMVGPFKKRNVYNLATSVLTQPVSTWSNFIMLSGFTTLGVNGTITGKTASITWYNEPSKSWKAMRDSTAILQPGKGYKVGLNTKDLSFEDSSGFYANTGTPVIGNGAGNYTAAFNLPISKSTSSGGWNLIANPYPCEIDWDAPTGWNKSSINNAYYVWDGATSNYKVYVGAGGSDVASIGSNGISPIINSGQGFWVYKPNIGNSSLTLTEDVKTQTANLPTFYRTINPDENVIRIFMKDSLNQADEAIIRLINNSTPWFDLQIDALKLEGETVNISSLTPANDALAINSLPFFKEIRIPLRVQSYSYGSHSLTFKGVDNFADTVSIMLKDTHLKSIIDLKKNLIYPFEITKDSLTYGNDRFEIILSISNTTGISKGTDNKSLVVYQNIPNPASDITSIRFDLPYSDNVEITIYNSLGQVIQTHNHEYKKGHNQYELETRGSIFSNLSGILFYRVNGCGKSEIKRMVLLK